MYRYFNPNPEGILIGDCVIRALCAVFDQPWEKVYMDLAVEGLKMHDMPSANRVWGSYLYKNRFRKYGIPDTCPDCYTVKNFCTDHADGTYILSTGTHVVAVKNGDYLDAWDSGQEVPAYYWRQNV